MHGVAISGMAVEMELRDFPPTQAAHKIAGVVAQRINFDRRYFAVIAAFDAAWVELVLVEPSTMEMSMESDYF